MSPLIAWERNWRTPTGVIVPRYPADPRTLFIDLLPHESRALRREGIHLNSLTYRSPALEVYLKPESRGVVRIDPRDISSGFLELPAGGHLQVPWTHPNWPRMSLWEWNEIRRRDYHRAKNAHPQVVRRCLESFLRRVHRRMQVVKVTTLQQYREPDSRVNGTLVTFVDVTSIVKAEQHQRLLVDELNHRVKNMLTVVISLATQTLRRCRTLEEFSETFLGRVRALTASYLLLSSQNWLRVSLKEILIEETKHYGMKKGASILMEGPEVKLAPAGALALGMAIHELATNAVKYGALSVSEGVVDIQWHIEPDELVLEWTERGGPPVEAPQKRGFGTTLIERGFAHELAGRASLDFDAEGIRVSLRAPLETTTVSAAPAAEGFQ